MNDMTKERMLDLLTDQILFGLSEEESAELKTLETLFPEFKNDTSLELTASAIGLTNLEEIEPLPAHLRTKILADADQFFNQKAEQSQNVSEELQQTFAFESKRPFLQWLGWAFAGLACIALAVSLWSNLQKPKVVDRVIIEQPKVLPVNEQYNNLLSSAKDLKKTIWTNPKNDKEILGEVVWSESEQKGFMKFTGLAANNAAQETYQLWIFDETQDPKTPIEGGIFDIAANGETIVPIKPNLKFKNPNLFAITVEKPGGVMVSKREKLVALAKVQA